MNDRLLDCPRCGGVMEAGMVLDPAHPHVSHLQTWVRGIPKSGVLGQLKVDRQEQLQVVAYRCQSCGRLESFALD